MKYCIDSHLKYECVLSHFSPVCFFVTPWTVAHQAPLYMGFSRQECLSPPGDLPDPGTEPTFPMSHTLAGGFFTTSATWEAPRTFPKPYQINCYLLCMLSCFSHVWLCDPMNCSLPGSSVRGIPQARVLEQVAIAFSGVSYSLFYSEKSCSNKSQTIPPLFKPALHPHFFLE